jgi:hypothetical protein
MASRGMIAARKAEIEQRIEIATKELAELTGISYPPDFPYARQPEYRANDKMDQAAIFIEALLQREKDNAAQLSDGKRSDRRGKAGNS